jgi:hypothetical protein
LAGAGWDFQAAKEDELHDDVLFIFSLENGNSLLLRAWCLWERWAVWRLGSVLRDPWREVLRLG